jgi:anthranilate synthase component 1
MFSIFDLIESSEEANFVIRPTLEEAKELSRGCAVIPIALEIFSDQKTPIEVLKNIREKSECCYILESVNGSDSWGRYSFLGYNPSMSVSGTSGIITIKNGNVKKAVIEEPIKFLRDTLSRHKSPRIPYLPPFTGGFVGYFAYDFVQYFIPGLKLNAGNAKQFQDFNLMLMDKVIVFDHFR